MEIKQNLTTTNRTVKSSRSIKYIVVHYTSNKNDTAYNNTQYFKSVNRGASAHYFVDQSGVWQCVQDKDVAWHCGASSYRHPYCRNNNSIGVEMCTSYSVRQGYYIDDKTTDNTVELVRWLMDKYDVPIDNVIRHYDVTGKNCPAPWVVDSDKWRNFKNRLQEDEDMSKYDDVINALGAEVAELQGEVTGLKGEIQTLKNPDIYNYIDTNMPEWAHEPVKWCMDKGIVKGTGDGLDLNGTKLWVCTVIYRTAKVIAKMIGGVEI